MGRTRLAATGLLCGLLIVSCGSGGQSGGGGGELSGTVVMWTNPIYDEAGMRKHYEAEAAAFEKAHPGVDIEITVNPWQGAQEKLTAALAARQGPDVVYLIPDRIPTLASQDLLVPMGDALGGDRADFNDNALDAVTYDGQVYAVPVLQSALPQVYDKRVLDEAGVEDVPTTWEEFAALGEQVKGAGYYLTEYHAHADMAMNISFYPWLFQAGGSVYSQDGTKVAFNSPQGLKALTYLKGLFDQGHAPKGPISEPSQIEETDVSRGKVAQVAFEPQRLVTLWGAENVRIAPPLKDERQVGYGTVGSYGVLKTADDTAAATEWVKWISRPEALREFDAASGFFAPRKSLNDLYADDPVLGEVEKLIPMMSTFGPHPKDAAEVSAALRVEIEAALRGQKTPQQALADAEAEGNRILSSGG
ncbi:extracellular solute-binding protein [Nonomuraea terrae]|uniref:extracellular solute-binding protein n=1 Tax=Nonomuraea terrae TaxID=2530383 RepID=UPI0037B30425